MLSERRGWLAAFNYKDARRKISSTLDHMLKQLPSVLGLAKVIAPNEIAGLENDRALFLDTTLVESVSYTCQPLSPGGHAFSASADAFQTLEVLLAKARSLGVSVRKNGDTVSDALGELAVVSGKYLPKSDIEALRHFEARGGNLYYLGTVPAYDEDLTTIGMRVRGREIPSHWDFARCN